MGKAYGTKEDGFTLIEMIISLGIALLIIGFSLSHLLSTLKMGKILKSRNLIAEFEDEIRRAATDGKSLKLSAAGNKGLYDCLYDNQQPCRTTQEPKPFDLYIDRKNLDPKILTGGFTSAGETCSGLADCPIEIKTGFLPRCDSNGPLCTQAESLVISYDIYVKHLLDASDPPPIRSGAIIFALPRKHKPTRYSYVTNTHCPEVNGRQTQFLQGIDGKKNQVYCIEAALPSAKLKVKQHTCTGDKILMGINKDGTPICDIPKVGGHS
jgi:prepilin-type N-terminal cleavage/methylation domain-containing protein